MNSPKIKAQELVDKFGNIETDITFVNSDSEIELASGYLTRNAAKQSALIAVDEILSLYWNDVNGIAFWNSVKNEINAL